MIYQYTQKFYLNTSHQVEFNNKLGTVHSHCFEFVIVLGTTSKDAFMSFNNIERKIEDELSPYQATLINTVSPFDVLNPTVENMCKYFRGVFADIVKSVGWKLLTITVSETPTRAFTCNVVEYEILGKQGDDYE